MKTWDGDKPECCELCGTKIEEIFVDGKTVHGPWAIMCPVCALDKGTGLGEGKGQMYCRHNTEFVKIKG